jgi:alkanesulfonate monooxygenase SsuD/methylene tetrahydromethanopterin reductase-like flavin-dependent oxidoreductase (luciferase family)
MEYVPIYMFDEDPISWCQAREREGWYGIGIPDHFTMSERRWGNVFVVAAQMASATRRLRIITTFANNLFRSPVDFARAALSLQQVSGGRFEAGLGAGYAASEVEAMGAQFPSGPIRARRYREAIQVTHDLLHSRACHFSGEHYTVSLEGFGPELDVPPPLLGSLGGPWTARNVSPFLDRIEIVSQSAALRGEVTLAAISQDKVAELAQIARKANPDAPMGVGLPVAVGGGSEIEAPARMFGNGFFHGLAGDAQQVAERIQELSAMGFVRCTLVSSLPGSYQRLATALLR